LLRKVSSPLSHSASCAVSNETRRGCGSWFSACSTGSRVGRSPVITHGPARRICSASGVGRLKLSSVAGIAALRESAKPSTMGFTAAETKGPNRCSSPGRARARLGTELQSEEGSDALAQALCGGILGEGRNDRLGAPAGLLRLLPVRGDLADRLQ